MTWEAPLFGQLLVPVMESAAETVKRTPAKLVTRHHFEGRVFYVKNYFYGAQGFKSFKYFFKAPPSRAEWELAPRLQGLGIPVVPHHAHGELRNWRGLLKSTLITEGLPGCVPLNPSEISGPLEAALGKFLRQLHDRAVFHADLHLSNLLYSSQFNEFCLVDLDNIKILPSISIEQRLENLTTLNRRFPLKREFLEAYGNDFVEYQEELDQRAQTRDRASIPSKLKLLFEHRQAFSPKKIAGLTWRVRQSSWNEKLESILKQPDFFLATRARILKNGTRSTVGCADGFVLKRFNFKKVSTVIFDVFRSSRARRGFRTARHLELLKIATPRPIAYADWRRFGFVMRGYFVMEEVAGAAFPWQRIGERGDRIIKLAELLAKVHDEGFSHRDLKETNILFDAQDIPQLIDLDALHFIQEISNKRAAIEVARLARGFARRGNISKSERLRFLKEYCRIRKFNDWRWWWNQVGENLAAPWKAK